MLPSLLISEPPLQVLRSLAKKTSLEQAIVIQQIYFLTTRTPCRDHKGEKWVSYTYAEWKDRQFPFWSERTIERLFDTLETKQIIISCQPDGFVRTKYYRLNQEKVQEMFKGKIDSQSAILAGCDQSANLAGSEDAKLADSHTNNKKESITTNSQKGDGYTVPACFEKVDGFTKALAGWIEARKKKRNPPTGYAIQLLINRLSEQPHRAVSALEAAIEGGWATVKWQWMDNQEQQNGTRHAKFKL